MSNSSGRVLRVGEAYPSDIGRGKARLHPATMMEMGLEEGDAIEGTHDQGTIGAHVYPAKDSSWPASQVEEDTIYIKFGRYLRGPSTDLTGQSVRVRRIAPPDAKRVVYQAPPPGSHPDVAGILSRRNLIGTLASTGTRMAVSQEVGTRRKGNVSGTAREGTMPLVHQTEPDGVVVVTEETSLEARLENAT